MLQVVLKQTVVPFLFVLSFMVSPCTFAATLESNSAINTIERIHTLGGIEQGYYDQSLFLNNLKMALEATKEDFGAYQLTHETLPMEQRREFKSLATGKLDIIWSMTSKPREQVGIAIRTPLAYGIYGYRLLLTNTQDSIITDQRAPLESLKSKVAVQGPTWPDTEILRYNGFNVQTTSWSNNMFMLLARDYFDYFPRSVFEIDDELTTLAEDNITLHVEPDFALYYPTAFFFFVTPNKPALAARLRAGLRRISENGSRRAFFDEYIEKRHSIRSLKQKEIIQLENPLLSDETLQALSQPENTIHFDNE